MLTAPARLSREAGRLAARRAAGTYSLSAYCAHSLPRFAPSRISGLSLIIGRIKTGQLHALLYLAKYPAFIKLVFCAFVSDELEQILGDDDRTIIVHHNNIA